ncbi:hypothetical protein HYZ99_05495 [Candidatus Peregrinibacteria bacterium]|nr:hypothetical protein [Candidatus Peregrinibacteria bacterium]
MKKTDAPRICGACKQPITVCPECGGKKCVAGCPDRIEDGCHCDDGDEASCEC